ncbi:hypothetical protein [Roseimicrobium gellanilyticum]|nr:hypothetical protein [Roseimicrobium gellanilyticum]
MSESEQPQKATAAKRPKSKKKGRKKPKNISEGGGTAAYPRHSLSKSLRIPTAILEQNAGKPCSEKEAATFVGVGFGGPFRLEISSCLKFGLLERPGPSQVGITELARRAIRPQSPGDDVRALQESVLKAPQISEVYQHYRGENLPEPKFFENALQDKFRIPSDKTLDFITIFEQTLESARLLQRVDDRIRLLDVSDTATIGDEAGRLKKLGREVHVSTSDSCFVMMPFAPPIGSYYEKIYDPAIRKAGLTPVRADNDIFGTGKIIEQIWSGINKARVLVAELTNRNPNVFYELGLAHALQKPVVLVACSDQDVPFDLRHIRVIYYDMTDPFWGQKLVEKISENILSALKNPDEAILPRVLERQ